jgi:hypothetical protein
MPPHPYETYLSPATWEITLQLALGLDDYSSQLEQL